MKHVIDINEFTYHLPEDRIALQPLDKRDDSKLLILQEGKISHQRFFEIARFLPEGSTLFFNNTKVIPARMLFAKETGAIIECFLLHPVQPTPILQQALATAGEVIWQCSIGNLKRWPEGTVLSLTLDTLRIEAELVDRLQGWVRFRWTPADRLFGEVIEVLGKTPLPPYIKRSLTPSDKERYQTVYASQAGAVAAPTAGLHFTPAVMESLHSKRISKEFITLHVGAGTFQPVKVENALDHVMHEEEISLTRENLLAIKQSAFMVAVGTTSLRLLESAYWLGVKLSGDRDAALTVGQHDPYEMDGSLTLQESMNVLLAYLDQKQVDALVASTSIYIHPGYRFRTADALITNFHQPGSTLMLLVAAFVGNHWKDVYQQALAQDYRFLSFGDSSLLFRAT